MEPIPVTPLGSYYLYKRSLLVKREFLALITCLDQSLFPTQRGETQVAIEFSPSRSNTYHYHLFITVTLPHLDEISEMASKQQWPEVNPNLKVNSYKDSKSGFELQFDLFVDYHLKSNFRLSHVARPAEPTTDGLTPNGSDGLV